MLTDFEHLWQQQGGKCYLCKLPMRRAGLDGPTRATQDHFYPRARGGGKGLDNKRLACSACNSLKGRLLPDELPTRAQFVRHREYMLTRHGADYFVGTPEGRAAADAIVRRFLAAPLSAPLAWSAPATLRDAVDTDTTKRLESLDIVK